MAAVRKNRSFAEGFANGSDRPELPYEIGSTNGRKREKAVFG
jgi:hypothetical protein